MSWQETYNAWKQDLITDGDAVDEFLELYLPSIDPLLAEYIKAVDGDELTDAEAIEIIYTRLSQL